MKSKEELKKNSLSKMRKRMVFAIEDKIKMAYASKDRSVIVGKYETRFSHTVWLDEVTKKEVEDAGFEVRDGYGEYEIII